ncbi:MAG: molybdopterin dinucleotide binding domain-containing protein [Acidimicrobiales bacterium]
MQSAGRETERRTICRLCAATCGMIVTVDDDRIVGVRGDPTHPASQGYSCPKGRALGAMYHDPHRLDHPLLHGERVGWPALVDDLGAHFRRLLADHGADSIGYYSATGQYPDKAGTFAERRFFGRLGTKQCYTAASVDIFPAFKAAELVTGFAADLQPVWEPENSPRVAIIVGQNPVVSHGYLTFLTDPIRRIREFRRDGGRLWVFDPRRTETARLADTHFAVRPGTDGLVLAWLIRELLIEGADRAELDAHTDPLDVPTLRDALEPFTLDVVATMSGIAADDLVELLTAIRASGKVVCMPGTGVTFVRDAVVTDWLVWVLMIVTGSLDQPGGVRFSRGFVSPLDERAVWAPAPVEGRNEPGPPSRPELPRWLGEYPVAAMADEIESGRLRALLVAGANPLTALPDPRRTFEALRKLEVLAVLDIMDNELTEIATHVLPVAHQLERADITLRDRGSYAAAVMPLGADRRPCWWVHAQMARQLGFDILDGLDPDATTDDDVLRLLVANFSGAGTIMKVDNADEIKPRGQSDELFERLVAAGPHGLMAEARRGWVHELAIPGGKWRIAPSILIDRLPQLLTEIDPTRLRLVSRRQSRRVNSARLTRPHHDALEPPDVVVHPSDAERFGIVDGMLVELRSDAGSVAARARVDDSIRPGAVSLTHGFVAVNVNNLISAFGVDPLTGQPQMSAIDVTLAPAAS